MGEPGKGRVWVTGRKEADEVIKLAVPTRKGITQTKTAGLTRDTRAFRQLGAAKPGALHTAGVTRATTGQCR